MRLANPLVYFVPILLVVASGCSSAWVVSQRPDGGVIGYKGYHSSESANEAIRNLIPCSSYEIVSDDLRGSNYQYTVNQPVTTTSYNNGTLYGSSGQTYNYYGTSSQTNYVPQTYSGVNYWREATYVCRTASIAISGRSISSSYSVPTNPVTITPEECTRSCVDLSNNGQLRAGVSLTDCIRNTCQN